MGKVFVPEVLPPEPPESRALVAHREQPPNQVEIVGQVDVNQIIGLGLGYLGKLVIDSLNRSMTRPRPKQRKKLRGKKKK